MYNYARERFIMRFRFNVLLTFFDILQACFGYRSSRINYLCKIPQIGLNREFTDKTTNIPAKDIQNFSYEHLSQDDLQDNKFCALFAQKRDCIGRNISLQSRWCAIKTT